MIKQIKTILILVIGSFITMAYTAVTEADLLKIQRSIPYLVEVSIGTPEQKFSVQLDTTTAMTWVPSTDCTECKQTKALYNHTLSNSSDVTNTTIVIDDKDGDAEGLLVKD